MCRTCGAASPGPFGVERARAGATPKRCCSSTTQTARLANSTSASISAWVPTTRPSSPAASRARVSRRRAAGVAPGEQRERDRLAGEQPVERRRVLLGERLGRRHQRRLVARLERPQHRVEGDDGLAAPDLPHQQPLHRPARARGRRRSRRSAARWSPVGSNGSESSQRSTSSPGRARSRSPGRPPARPRRRSASATWWQEQLLEGEPLARRARPPRESGEVDARAGRRRRRRGRGGPGARPAAARSRRPARVDRLPDPLAQPAAAAARSEAGWTGTMPGRVDARRLRACRRRSRAPRPGSPARSSLPLSSSRVPGRSRSASQAWLNQVAFSGPLDVGDIRLDDPQVAPPRRPHPRRADLDHDRRLLADPQLGRPRAPRSGRGSRAGHARAGRRASRSRARPRPRRASARPRAGRYRRGEQRARAAARIAAPRRAARRAACAAPLPERPRRIGDRLGSAMRGRSLAHRGKARLHGRWDGSTDRLAELGLSYRARSPHRPGSSSSSTSCASRRRSATSPVTCRSTAPRSCRSAGSAPSSTSSSGYQAARLVGLSIFASLEHELGDLDRVSCWVKALGLVQCAARLRQAAGGDQRVHRPVLELWGRGRPPRPLGDRRRPASVRRPGRGRGSSVQLG